MARALAGRKEHPSRRFGPVENGGGHSACPWAHPIEAIEAVALTKAIEQRGAHEIAKRALETMGQIFRYAIAYGFVKRNPAVESSQATP